MYKIIRFYENGRRRTIYQGLTLAMAQEHCSSPKTEGRTRSGVKWFDGFEKY